MLKRTFDITASLIGLLLLSPVLLVSAVGVKLTSPGPVFYRQKRVGRHGREFGIFKFRTMRVGSDRAGQLTLGDRDPRVTSMGVFLRKTKLDELPQLFNVVAGHMSLVGPRPEVPRYVALYSPEQRRVLSVRPGITDPASIKFRDEAELLGAASDPEQYYIDTIMPEKLRINLQYIDSRSFVGDIRVIMQTFMAIGAKS